MIGINMNLDFIIMEDIMPLFRKFFQPVSVLENIHPLSKLYENSYPTSCSFFINIFILNMVYKFQVSNLWLLILSLATIGIMKGKEAEFAAGKNYHQFNDYLVIENFCC